MLLPYQPLEAPQGQTLIREFGGLNRKTAIEENEFADMENLTSEDYPLLRTRRKRVTVKRFAQGERPNGFSSKGAIVFTVDNGVSSKLFVNNREVTGVTLTRADKQIVGMGAYAVIFPDGFFVNLVDTSDNGYLAQRKEITATQAVPLTLTPCTFDGTALDGGTVGTTAPANPQSGDVWVDTNEGTAVYKIWNESTGQWVQQSTVYIRIGYGGLGQGFSQWDGVSISGLSYSGTDSKLQEQVAALNLDGALLQQVGTDFIEIAGIINTAVSLTGTIVIERKLPQLDFVTECNNRLWGCRFGVVDGKVVNEILACKQGDFKNWYSYPGISTDSYAMSLGTDGAFTGAATYLGTPVFFKENYIHKIYGETPASFTMAQTIARGVGRDMGESLVTNGNALFYRSAVDFCAWGGGYPQEIGRKLGDLNPTVVRGECLGGRLYFYTESEALGRALLIFDTDTGLWHKEGCDVIHAFARDGHILYALAENADGYRIDAMHEDFGVILIDENTTAMTEGDVHWYAETGDIGFGSLSAKYVKRIFVRAKLGCGSTFRVEISYDGGAFRPVTEKQGTDRPQAVTITIKPVRCEDFRLRLSGVGDCAIISIGKTIGQGSEKT